MSVKQGTGEKKKREVRFLQDTDRVSENGSDKKKSNGRGQFGNTQGSVNSNNPEKGTAMEFMKSAISNLEDRVKKIDCKI